MNNTVIITGGARRIGRGLAIQFANSGWNVGIIYNKSAEQATETVHLIQKTGVKAFSIQADVSQHDEIQNAIAEMKNHFGDVQVLVNNAAIYPERQSLSELTIDSWELVMNTNLRSILSSSQKFAEIAQSGARIINIASLGAFRIWKQRIPYNVSKAGVIQLTKALALELAPDISVNSVSPGTIEIKDEAADAGALISVDKIPMKRYGNVNDVFDAVYFFANCSSFITGQNLSIDGGFSL
ncbi:MAG: short-chain dehydrogenase [Ignavibacteriae bacterium HGW-Ignavibacteriae-1]|jgi:NAD(P)-dependent dehydrogenase (short-subunit alcohol dehydrogenase family)|nr:MAG: short-chain dehydrogenase [Ignavibacteriae bacterium HGW-Ignavibacteriae-1]